MHLFLQNIQNWPNSWFGLIAIWGFSIYFIYLLCDSDKSGVTWHFLDAFGADVGTGWSDSTEEVVDGAQDLAFQRKDHCFAFRWSVLCYTSAVLVHCCITWHSIEFLKPLPCFLILKGFTSGFDVSSEHATGHDEICASAEGLGEVSWHSASSISDSVSSHGMCNFCIFQNGTKLWIATPSLLSRGAYRAWPNS